MLRSSAELWNRTETIPSHDGIYRLRFAAGSHKEGTWDPGYFNFFRTPKQLHEKVAHQEARIDDLGGVLVGTRNVAAQTITNRFAAEPLTDPMGTVRGDWQVSNKDLVGAHYSIERLRATGAASFSTVIQISMKRSDFSRSFKSRPES